MSRTARPPTVGLNRLLTQLSTRDRLSLTRLCEPVALEFGAVLAEPDAAIRYVYFPLTGFVSVMVPAEQGAALEVGLIGNEGMLGGTTPSA